MGKKFEAVKLETFNTKKGKKQYIVARHPNGTMDQRRAVKGTRKAGLFIEDFRLLYKDQASLYEDRIRDVRRHITQVSILKPVSHEPAEEKTKTQIKNMSPQERREYKQSIKPARDRKPLNKGVHRGKAMYAVEAVFEGKKYNASSKFIGAKAADGYVFPDSETAKACKQSAYDNLYKQISVKSKTYDADEGLRLIKKSGLTNVKEGWIYFTGGGWDKQTKLS